MECQDARGRIQSYLDGELAEAQAAPLRKHLLDCQPCRASAQSEKNLKRWFVEPKALAVAVPRDFSARVARRAFAGDRGERFSEPPSIQVATVGGPRISVMHGTSRPDERNLRFVLALTAAAAIVLVLLSVAIQSSSVPSGSRLLADDSKTMTFEDATKSLERLNQPVVGDASSPANEVHKTVESKK